MDETYDVIVLGTGLKVSPSRRLNWSRLLESLNENSKSLSYMLFGMQPDFGRQVFILFNIRICAF